MGRTETSYGYVDLAIFQLVSREKQELSCLVGTLAGAEDAAEEYLRLLAELRFLNEQLKKHIGQVQVSLSEQLH